MKRLTQVMMILAAALSGIGKALSQKLFLGAEESYFNILDHNIAFGTLGLALNISF